MKVLEELYYGNIQFDSAYYGKNTAFVQAARKKHDSMEKLLVTLNEAEKELLEQYCEADGDIVEITRYDTYVNALRFGILLMVEIFTRTSPPES